MIHRLSLLGAPGLTCTATVTSAFLSVSPPSGLDLLEATNLYPTIKGLCKPTLFLIIHRPTFAVNW